MATTEKFSGFTQAERDAMRARAKELAAEAKSTNKRAQGEKDVQEAIAAMPEIDRVMAERLHEIITKATPQLWPKTWYGFPAYAKNDKVVCFFQGTYKFKTRYATLCFSDTATLDEGEMWPVAFALKKLTAKEESQITELVKKAAGA